METIKFQRVLCIMALAPGLMVLSGCESGSSTVPTSVTAAENPPTTSPAPTPTPVLPAPTPTPAPTAKGTATVIWTAPSNRVDGSSITMGELAGYRVYWGTSASNLSNVANVAGASATQYKVTGLSVGTHYFKVTAYDTAGSESPKSGVASKGIL